MVDERALDSVLREAPPAPKCDIDRVGFVYLVNGSWEPYESDNGLDEDESGGDSEPEEPRTPLEGCTLEDVGWMRVSFEDATLGMYCRMRDQNSWDIMYQRPPAVGYAQQLSFGVGCCFP